jgi:hypothetical protein
MGRDNLKTLALYALSLCMFMTTWSPVSAEDNINQFIIINKSTNELAFYVDGEKVKTFSVATGLKPSYTPEGVFKIVNKIKNRPYYKENIAGGDKNNPLGDRWLGLEVNETKGTTYAIHGNSNKASIGKYVSAGCIRMNNDEVRWLFEQVKLNISVIITSSDLSFDEIALQHNFSLAYTPLDGDIVIDGVIQQFEQRPVIYKGRTLVPMRSIFEAFGATVGWEKTTQTITATKNELKISHIIHSSEVIVDNKVVELEVGSKVKNGHTLVPLRFVAEALGAHIEWDVDTQSIHITTTPR